METIGPEDAAWLASPEGFARLAELSAEEPTPRLVAQLRKQFSPTRTSALLEVKESRRRGFEKFQQADELLLSRRGVQQSTDQWIASYKAERFRGIESAVDIGCGVGGDLMALAAVAGNAIGVERNQALATFAAHNVRICKVAAVVECREATDSGVAESNAWHADPDRRVSGRRTVRLEGSEPSLEVLERWRGLQGNFALKLAPAAMSPEHWRADSEFEWISRAGECRQLVVWGGSLVREVGRCTATRVVGGPETPCSPSLTFSGAPGIEPTRAAGVGDWVFEPDPAVLAASLTGAIAAREGLQQYGEVAYLTGNRPVSEPLLSSFRVVEQLSLDKSRLRSWLQARDVGPIEIKCRGVRVDPEKLRRELGLRGDQPMVLLIAPTPTDPRKPTVVAAQRADEA